MGIKRKIFSKDRYERRDKWHLKRGKKKQVPLAKDNLKHEKQKKRGKNSN